MASSLLILGRGGMIDARRIVMIAPYHSKPVRRLVLNTRPEKVFNLTYGQPKRAILLLTEGYFIVTHRTAEELMRALSEVHGDEPQTPWW
jgi:regulator of extracellular matrix RemA (YlzA/DUF370 family)